MKKIRKCEQERRGRVWGVHTPLLLTYLKIKQVKTTRMGERKTKIEREK